MIEPGSPAELAECLAQAAAGRQTIRLGGNFTKDRWLGPWADAEVIVSTRRSNRILLYEPSDLTVSVEAGISYAELSRVLAQHGQMIPLDPPWAETSSIGGVLAANSSGPRRRLYGTARDMVIGMTFATLEGKLVQSGGMVVKNVAGLDMAKLMIGSYGSLAAIAAANFRVHPIPAGSRTFEWKSRDIANLIGVRDRVLRSPLQPAAIDLLKDAGEYRLLAQAGGSAAVLDRYSRELRDAHLIYEEAEEQQVWRAIREFIPAYLESQENGSVECVSCKLTEVGSVMERHPGPALGRAGTGVVYLAQPFARPERPQPSPTDLKIKSLFDPHGLLNRHR